MTYSLPTRGVAVHDAGYVPPRTPLLRTSVNRLWALLRACPLHAVEHLLRLGQELLEVEGGRL
jgi:hypothetical protein